MCLRIVPVLFLYCSRIVTALFLYCSCIVPVLFSHCYRIVLALFSAAIFLLPRRCIEDEKHLGPSEAFRQKYYREGVRVPKQANRVPRRIEGTSRA
ncbi:uncharacterized protein M421DRAFT_150725 [Didymella exigua CBS 183.55]|uniref:Uncharacterized protein n=1 Tax=Didymella exigua CBS 183.55 TaxID=1150837 RepID=A0A6A5RMF1_9PLEO|nr:uncharacterized protein M421DRAFT_150725 [Didymella exigua CBS 183.55]KAF1928613.1 hypothetical protein M421DRAFT_150725 [Didymella exigua CBS 183.55]